MRPDGEVEHVVDDLHVRVPFAAVFLVREVEVPEALYRMARGLELGLRGGCVGLLVLLAPLT